MNVTSHHCEASISAALFGSKSLLLLLIIHVQAVAYAQRGIPVYPRSCRSSWGSSPCAAPSLLSTFIRPREKLITPQHQKVRACNVETFASRCFRFLYFFFQVRIRRYYCCISSSTVLKTFSRLVAKLQTTAFVTCNVRTANLGPCASCVLTFI
jgi:hypothetical protein